MLQVVSLQPDLTGLPSRRVQQLPDLPTALARLRAQPGNRRKPWDRPTAHRCSNSERGINCASPGSSPCSLIGPDAIRDTSNDVGADQTKLGTLCTDLAAGERSGVAVVTAGLPEDLAGTRIDIDMRGAAAVDAHRVRVEQMPVALGPRRPGILDTTTAPDQPVAPAPHPGRGPRR